MADPNAQSGASGWGNLLGEGAGALANYWGNSSATNALVGGENNAINTQTGLQGQLSGIYGSQRAVGAGADASLAGALGLGGAAPNYSGFTNNPGYQFAVQQGDQAINRQASANGNLYTPNTLAMLSQYNTGYASQNYNNYINQLMQSAGLGAQGNSGLAQGLSQSSNNVSQLQQNQGNARAGGTANSTGIASNLLSKVPWGQVGSTVGSWFGSNNTGASEALGGINNSTNNVLGNDANSIYGSTTASNDAWLSQNSGGSTDPGNYWDSGYSSNP